MVQGRLVVAWIEAPTSTATPRRIGQHHRVAGYRVQRVGATQVGAVAEIVPRHRQPHRVEVATDHAGGRAVQRRQLRADRARYIVNHFAAQPLRSMQRHRRSAGLLQRLIGEQPVARAGQLGELGDRAAAQQHRLHQHRCPVAELLAQRGDLADAVGQRKSLDRGQRSRALVRRQVGDVVEAEIQDGLIPVISTL